MLREKDLLRTHNLSGAVIDLIDEAQKFCYLVSPYVQLWPQLEKAIHRAASRRVPVTIITRYPDPRDGRGWYEQDYSKRLGAEIIVLDRLHTKLYVSDRSALLCSMNLVDSSQVNNFELGVRFERSDAAMIKRQVIDAELLLAQPRVVIRSELASGLHAERQRMAALKATFPAKGFCAVCAAKIDLDWRGRYYRCLPCWQGLPDADPLHVTTKFCHYCGQSHPGFLASPFHDTCHSTLREFSDWERLNLI
jgi:phosphatidylserine/phosphatidylglycerophosphate/cardiolipin synthase-like enzyme